MTQLIAAASSAPGPHAGRRADRLRPWEVAGLWGLVALFVVFAIFAEVRGAFLRRPMTDVQVYLRAAWAARTGGDVYAVTDDNHWHYHYPPLLAIFAAPLADAPPGADRSGLLPYAVSVEVWYWVSVAFLVAGVHVLASALEPLAGAGSRRWWALRVLPLLNCVGPILATLARGQVNLILLALLCFAAAAGLRGRPWRAGLWLAAAVCLKVIPAFLLLYPLWRRDYRCLGGCALGLLLGMVLIPAAWFGPARTTGFFVEWYNVLLRPALGTGGDQSRYHELIAATSTDSQSPVAMIHNAMHLDRLSRAPVAAPWVHRAHWLCGALMTVVTLLAAGWRGGGHRTRPLIFLGALVLVMLMLSPVCHLHYFCLALPLVMTLMARQWEKRGAMRLGAGLMAVLVLNFAANVVTHLPGTDLLREGCLVGYVTVILWLAAVVTLWKTRPEPTDRPWSPALCVSPTGA